MGQVVILQPFESGVLNPDAILTLCEQKGSQRAEEMVCRALEELAMRLDRCDRAGRHGDIDGLRRAARSMVQMADQIGLAALARAATALSDAADQRSPVAISATLARLMRVGEQSLLATWNVHGLSI